MSNIIIKNDLVCLARQAYTDGICAFLSGRDAAYYSGQLHAYITLLVEYYDEDDQKILEKFRTSQTEA